jgi:predicted nucleic acid-binding protein
MSFLLDTNVVSEWIKPRPNPGLIGWMESADEDRIFISVVSLAELRYGVERMAAGRRRSRLEDWLRDELPLRFEAHGIHFVGLGVFLEGNGDLRRNTGRLSTPLR